MKKFCLNMIVKNESAIIKETLINMSKYIDYWVISDTGSIDNTIEIIKKTFEELGIPGEIYEDQWEDFGTNRTIAINHAYQKCDYIWMMDSDDLIRGEIIFPDKMDKDMYILKIGNDFTYYRPHIFKSSLKWRYRGVLHEFIDCIDKNPSSEVIKGDYYMDSRRLGNRSNDENKYLKDVNILTKAIEINKEPDLKSRYMFYAGQSYYDCKDYEKALHWYYKRIEEGGWNEEVYYSSLKVGYCMKILKYSENDIIKHYLKTYSIIQERPEALYYLGIYLKNQAFLITNNDKLKKEKLNRALSYLIQLDKRSYDDNLNSNRLFLNTEIDKWKCRYEIAILNYHLKNYEETIKICDELLFINELRIDDNIWSKIKELELYATKYDRKILTKYPKEKIEQIINSQKKINNKKIVCTMTTCKKTNLFIETINSFINCCNDIDLIDKWIFIDDNSPLEDRDVMKYEYPFIEWICKDKNNKGHAKSMNSIYEMTKDYEYILHLEDDWLFIKKGYYIKPALDILISNDYNYLDNRANNLFKDKKIGQVLFNLNYSEDIDKVIYGGYLAETKTNSKTKFIIHEYYPDNVIYPLTNKCNCAYWPHYSFRPSLIKREIFDTIGHFDTNGFFERKYADKYYEHGYISSFLDKISCIHIT